MLKMLHLALDRFLGLILYTELFVFISCCVDCQSAQHQTELIVFFFPVQFRFI